MGIIVTFIACMFWIYRLQKVNIYVCVMFYCVINLAGDLMCARSEWWEGQNKRTGEVGEFPEIVFSLLPLRAVAQDNTAHASGTKQMAQSSANAESGKNTLDKPLIDFGNLASSCVGIATSDDAPAKVSSFANWTTFESTTDLHVAAQTNPISSADVTTAENAKVSTANKTTRNYSDSMLSSSQTNSMPKGGSESFDDRRHAVMDTGRKSDYDYDAEVDVSDSVLLLPSANQTSVSEPCSPAHMAGVDKPDLLVTSDNACFIDDSDSRGLCRSLPASNMTERLSWMTSASCENLNSGAAPTLNNNSLCSTQFAEHLSKASSDSPVYVGGGGNAPPVPPRDYPSRSHPLGDHNSSSLPKNRSTQQHTEIHPIMQDGQRRSSTHYWLLPDKQRLTALPMPCGSDEEAFSYVNVPDSRSGREKSARKAAKAKQPLSPGAEISHSQMDDMMKRLDISMVDQPLESMAEIRDKVELIRVDVGFDAVTFEESLNALSLNHWSVEEAIQYIKIEHLFRLGIASRDVCREALVAFQWDLLKAASCLVDRQSASAEHSH